MEPPARRVCDEEEDGRQVLQFCEAKDPPERQKGSTDPLSSAELEHFEEHGFVVLREAFSSSAAVRARDELWRRLEEDGIVPSDCSTWCRRHG